MSKKEKCDNLNHRLNDVKIKYCVDCGHQFSALKSVSCNDIKHAQRRKDRNVFCRDCGKKLSKIFED